MDGCKVKSNIDIRKYPGVIPHAKRLLYGFLHLTLEITTQAIRSIHFECMRYIVIRSKNGLTLQMNYNRIQISLRLAFYSRNLIIKHPQISVRHYEAIML